MSSLPRRFEADPRYPTPGVYFEDAARRQPIRFTTGHPAFLGLAQPAPGRVADRAVRMTWLTDWQQFADRVGRVPEGGFLDSAVRGFFENGGQACMVISSAPSAAGAAGSDEEWRARMTEWLRRLESAEDELGSWTSRSRRSPNEHRSVDLVCAPDLPQGGDLRRELQREVLAHCDAARTRFAILDTPPDVSSTDAVAEWQSLVSPNGALYFPWLKPESGPAAGGWIPPCGHVAGVYARTDDRLGVHKAPANEPLEGVVDVRVQVADEQQRVLNSAGVNCVRVLPGRGIRVWGARTLSGRADWRFVNVRRLFITVRRWIEYDSRDVVFEANDSRLWNRIRDRLNNYCYSLFQAGALKGLTPEEAYYVKCDAETNPPERRDAGEVITELGLAAIKPAEFVVVRVVQSVAGGATVRT